MPEEREPPNPAGGSTTLEEYEAHVAAPAAAPKASDFKLEGDDVPEEFRGKTAAEVAKEAKAFSNALRMSEAARESQKAALDMRTSEQPAPKHEPVEEVVMTREQLAELYATDPIAAMEKVTEIAEKRAEKNFNARLSQMETGTFSVAEDWAKQEYPDEFALFGDDIKKLANSIPNKALMSTKKGWEEAVTYVRGQKGNFEKLMDKRQNPGRSSVEARLEQEREAGHSSGGNGVRGRIPAEGVATLDAVQEKIAQEFIDSGVFKDKAEYIKWSKLGGA